MAKQLEISAPVVQRGSAYPLVANALGGGLEGAERTTRETVAWAPAIISPDRQLNPVKDMADARARDMVQNDGHVNGAVYTHRDSIVGSEYRLNAMPDWEFLKVPESWAEEFQQVVEARWRLMAESERCWLDASGKNTFTGMIRLGVGGFLMTGEILLTSEWIRSSLRPYSTAFQMVSPTRLSNPDGKQDEKNLRRGVVSDYFGRAIGYWFRSAYPNDFATSYDALYKWDYVPATKPWGRDMVCHIVEQMLPGQTRGVADMVSALKEMRMTKKFKEITLQQAVVQATYAAAIESELPRELVLGSLGAGQAGLSEILGNYLSDLGRYVNAADNIKMDGVRIPHLFPGTKMNLQSLATPGGIGQDFEASLHRHTAQALGLSYEEFTRDYTKTNYSSARATTNQTHRFMQGRKKAAADRQANMMYSNCVEEMWNAGDLPMPPGWSRADFYKPLNREAICRARWIGASRGQIDEMKESQAAILRINAGISTYEAECARLALDFRDVFRQRAREEKLKKEYNLTFTSDATKPTPAKSNEDEEQNEKEDA